MRGGGGGDGYLGDWFSGVNGRGGVSSRRQQSIEGGLWKIDRQLNANEGRGVMGILQSRGISQLKVNFISYNQNPHPPSLSSSNHAK